MKISIITDEISDDPETAIELGTKWGVRYFELRDFFTDRVPSFTAYQKQRLHDMLEENQARIIAISPGLFKVAYPPKRASRATLGWMDRADYETWVEAHRLVRYRLDELLPASLDYANELSASLVVIFGFDRAGALPGEPPEEVLNCLRLAAEQAGAAGLQLVIETESGYWADSGGRSAHIVQTINHPALGINWDPANAFCAGDKPYPIGYEAVRGLVRHVHFKDAACDQKGEPYYTLEGQIDWTGQIRALAADGYEGFISVETHMRPKVFAAKAALERLCALITAA